MKMVKEKSNVFHMEKYESLKKVMIEKAALWAAGKNGLVLIAQP